MTQNHWHANAVEHVKFAPLTGAISVDLAIVGAGFTGLSAALHAAKSGMRVAVIDAHFVGFGGSGRNVGLVNAGLWLPPEQVIATLGDRYGNRLIDRLSRAPDDVFDLIKTYQIQCDAHRNGTLHLAHSAAGLQDLEHRNAQWQARGVATRVLTKTEVEKETASHCYYGALHDPRAGVIQPFDYVRGLARAAAQEGALIFEETLLRDAKFDRGTWHLATPHGSITAANVLNATNAYGPLFGAPTTPQTAWVHYFQTVTDPIPDAIAADILPQRHGVWDTALIMSSFRMTRDNRLVFGSMGNSDGAHGGIHKRWARQALNRIYPQLSHIGLGPFWSGRIAMTDTKIPKVVINNNCATIFGYSGRGIAPGTAMGQEIAKYFATPNPDDFVLPMDHAYSEPLTRAKSAYYEMGATVTHLASGLRTKKAP